MATTLLDVVCPEGTGEGQLINVEHGGQSFGVTVPKGLSVGGTFQVELALVEPEAEPEPSLSDFDELAGANDITSLSDDEDDDAGYYGGGDPSAGSAAQAVVSAAVQASRLKPHEAASLRRIMKPSTPSPRSTTSCASTLLRTPSTRPMASTGSSGRASIGSLSSSSRRAFPSSSTSSTLTMCAGSLSARGRMLAVPL